MKFSVTYSLNLAGLLSTIGNDLSDSRLDTALLVDLGGSLGNLGYLLLGGDGLDWISEAEGGGSDACYACWARGSCGLNHGGCHCDRWTEVLDGLVLLGGIDEFVGRFWFRWRVCG